MISAWSWHSVPFFLDALETVVLTDPEVQNIVRKSTFIITRRHAIKSTDEDWNAMKKLKPCHLNNRFLWLIRKLVSLTNYEEALKYSAGTYMGWQHGCAGFPGLLQIIQNKLLKLLLKWDRRTPTDFVHHRLSILKDSDVHSAKVLSFVNECRARRVPDIFVEYFRTRETGLNLRNRSSLDIPWARTDMGLSRCDVRGARLWNNHLQTVTPLLYKKSFHKQISKFFIRNYE